MFVDGKIKILQLGSSIGNHLEHYRLSNVALRDQNKKTKRLELKVVNNLLIFSQGLFICSVKFSTNEIHISAP